MENFNTFKIYQAGTGGTGGYLSLILSKFLKDISKKKGLDIEYNIFDEDIVEEKNIKRQNFFTEDVGKNKAEVIGKRYGIVWNAIPLTEYIVDLDALASNEGVNIILGCTDSIDFRINMIKYLKTREANDILWVYIDGGNLDTGGQVLVAHNLTNENVYSENIQDIEKIFVEAAEEESAKSSESCSDLGDQTIGMNYTSALYMYNILTEFISTSKITCNTIAFRRYRVNFNVNQGLAMLNRTW